MLRNLFLKTLRDAQGLILAWGTGLAIIAGVLVYVFSSVRDDASLKSLDAMIGRLSPLIRAFMGGGQEIPSITTFEGFMQVEFFNYLPLLLSIFTIVEGSAAIALEQERRTIELLMAQPIRRWQVVFQKFAALVVGVYAIAAFAGFGLVVATRVVPVDPSWSRMMLAAANAVPPALVVGALSLLASCVLRRRRHAVIVGAVFLIVSFFLNVLGQVAPMIKPWRTLSIFYAYSASHPLTGDPITDHTRTLLVATFILVLAAVFFFRHKELAT